MAREIEATWRNLVKVTIPIDDLLCGGGRSLTIERQLVSLNGVGQAYVNPHTEMAYIVFDPCRCSVDRVHSMIRDLGYRPGVPQVRPRF